MMKFWMVAMITILTLGSMTGCPDGDDDYDADADPDTSEDSSDADADAETDTAEDDGDTSEVADCPNIAGDWALTYRESESGMEGHYILTLEQDGCFLIGWDDTCDYTGTVAESGYISLYRDCYHHDRTVSGNFTQTPPRMEGSWYDDDLLSGTWWADPQ